MKTTVYIAWNGYFDSVLMCNSTLNGRYYVLRKVLESKRVLAAKNFKVG